MAVMSKKQGKGTGKAQPAGQPGRVLVGIPPDVHQQLKLLAEHNNRPLTWELKAALVKHLEENGMWPPPGK